MTFHDAYRKLLDALKDGIPDGKARALAIQHLEESAFWASAAMVKTDSPITLTTDADTDLKLPDNVVVFPRKPS